MRVQVVLDDDLLHKAQELTGIRSVEGVITEALKLFVRVHEQQGLRKLRGKVDWDGDLGEMRRGRGSDPDQGNTSDR